jgi:hypothetical protein
LKITAWILRLFYLIPVYGVLWPIKLAEYVYNREDDEIALKGGAVLQGIWILILIILLFVLYARLNS